ncbi:N,N-dimethylformamidase beta subunit family domain-containing protein [Streptomyces sp. NPDC127106]|uniref:N,N-dimethylformamidase beta subunit family domain-containing protein n=1 Tax=Streptomyces sp. NPDC127106 TaxID=3345360 RepID=UPI00362A8DAB
MHQDHMTGRGEGAARRRFLTLATGAATAAAGLGAVTGCGAGDAGRPQGAGAGTPAAGGPAGTTAPGGGFDVEAENARPGNPDWHVTRAGADPGRRGLRRPGERTARRVVRPARLDHRAPVHRPTHPGHWLFEGTGVKAGDRFAHLVGVEYDKVDTGFPTPRPMEILAHSPVVCEGRPSHQDTAYYTVASGAGVFATGTMRWVEAGTRRGTAAGAPTTAWTRGRAP